MPRKRKAAGRKFKNPSPAKRAKLNPKNNSKRAQSQAMDGSSNNKAAQPELPLPVVRPPALDTNSNNKAAQLELLSPVRQLQALDANSNNKVAQANPPSPVSSCASSAANSPSPSNRTQLTLIEDAKSGFVDKLIEMKVVLIAIIKRNTIRSSVTTAVYADQTGDIQQVIWEDQWYRYRQSLQGNLGEAFTITGSTRNLKGVTRPQFNRGTGRFELAKNWTVTAMSSVEQASFYKKLKTLSLRARKLVDVTKELIGEKFDLVVKVVSYTDHNYKHGPTKKVVIADETSQTTVFISEQDWQDCKLSIDTCVILKQCTAKLNDGYVNINIGVIVPAFVTRVFYADTVADFGKVVIPDHSAEPPFVEAEYVECSVKKHNQKLRALKPQTQNGDSKTLDLEVLGKYAKVYHEMTFMALLNPADVVYQGSVSTGKKLKGLDLENAKKAGHAVQHFWSVSAEFRCISLGNKTKVAMLWKESAEKLLGGLTADEFAERAEHEQAEVFKEVTGKKFRVHFLVQTKTDKYGRLRQRVCQIEKM